MIGDNLALKYLKGDKLEMQDGGTLLCILQFLLQQITNNVAFRNDVVQLY